MVSVYIFGFSVTESTPGYVEQLDSLLGEGFKIKKIGIGGVHPNHVKYIFGNLLNGENADIVVLDFSTSAFRGWLGKKEYVVALLSIVFLCLMKGSTPLILDLPRKDVVLTYDWVRLVHLYLSREIGIGYLDVDTILKKAGKTIETVLKDDVHPNEEGVKYYAEYIAEYLREFVTGRLTGSVVSDIDNGLATYQSAFRSKPFFEAVSGKDNIDFVDYSRGGLTKRFLCIPQGHKIDIKPFEDQLLFSGMSYLMGPRSGTLQVLSESQSINMDIIAYDKFCYYQRMGAREFVPIKLNQFYVTQTAELPSIDLLKGDKDTSGRIGNVGDMFFTSPCDLSLLIESNVFLKTLNSPESKS